jgi:hypothetical protein
MSAMPVAKSHSLPVDRVTRVAPAAVALVWPGIIWCGASLSPAFLIVSLTVPIFAAWSAYRMAAENLFPRARKIAHLAIGCPALYSFLGGQLDFQQALPFHADAFWMVLWTSLAVLAALEQPAVPRVSTRSRNSRLAFAHGISAAIITAFAVIHLSNHLSGIWSGDLHIAFMKRARTVYRNPLVEPVLAAAVLFQFLSGVVLIGRRLDKATARWIDTLQTGSGAYLMCFFLSHIGAVVRARFVRHIDTNWIWLTGSNLLTDAWSARLTPYYFLGVIALGLHGACGVRKVLAAHGKTETAIDLTFEGVIAAAVAVALVIMIGMVRASLP